jgi:hypothetical protein
MTVFIVSYSIPSEDELSSCKSAEWIPLVAGFTVTFTVVGTFSRRSRSSWALNVPSFPTHRRW